jgi:hypothetical protein
LFNCSGYNAACVGKHSVDNGEQLYTYKFKLEDGTRYIVNIQVFEEINTCVVKFYLKRNENSSSRYNTIVNKGKAREVFKTVLKISLDFYKTNPTISFGFIGASRLKRSNGRGEESYNKTSRFEIYRYLTMSTRFGRNKYDSVSILDKFDVFEDENSSIMLLVNSENNDPNTLRSKVEKIVNEDYKDIFGHGLNVEFNRYTNN